MADLDTEAAPEGNTRRETISAMFDAAEAPEPVETVTTPPEPVEAATTDATEAPRTAAEKARDETGRFAKGPKVTVKPTPKPIKAALTAKPATGAASSTAATTAAIVSGTAPGIPGEATATALKPPNSWKPAAREHWAKLPAEVQQEAIRRERETQQALTASDDARKNWGNYQQAIAPYMGMIQAEGGDPISAASTLFRTAAALRTAPPGHKARLVADIVKTYGIDIQLLDQELAGQAPQQTQAPQQGQFRDPRFDQFLQDLEGQKRQRQQAMNQQHAAEVETFGANAEFFDDVRQEMADLLEVSARRGVEMTLENAYSRAVKLHPEVSKVMAQRETAAAATATQATTQRARAAASSVRSRPSGPAPTQAPVGRRAQIDAAFDALNNR